MSGRATIKIGEGNKERSLTIKVRDLSKTGMGFLHNEPMETETYFTLCLGGDSSRKRESDICFRVISCRAVGDDCYSIGAKICTAI